MNVGGLAGPLFVVLGALILRQRPRHAMGRLYVAVGVLLVAFAVGNSWLVEGLANAPRLAVGWFTSWAWVVPPLLVGTFGLLLPDGRLPSPRWRWVARASALAMLGFVIGMPYDDSSVDPRLVAAMPDWGAPAGEVALLSGVGLALAMIPVCLAAPFVRMRRGGGRSVANSPPSQWPRPSP